MSEEKPGSTEPMADEAEGAGSSTEPASREPTQQEQPGLREGDDVLWPDEYKPWRTLGDSDEPPSFAPVPPWVALAPNRKLVIRRKPKPADED